MKKSKLVIVSVLLSCAIVAPICSIVLNHPRHTLPVVTLLETASVKLPIANSIAQVQVVDIMPVKITGSVRKPAPVVKEKPTETCWLHELEGGTGGTVMICDSKKRTPINQQ